MDRESKTVSTIPLTATGSGCDMNKKIPIRGWLCQEAFELPSPAEVRVGHTSAELRLCKLQLH